MSAEEPLEYWIRFYDDGNGEHATPIGPFSDVQMGSTRLNGISAEEPQLVAYLQGSLWTLTEYAALRAGYAGEVAFPSWQVEARRPPPKKDWYVLVRETKEVWYHVRAQSEDRAKATYQEKGDLHESEVQEETILQVSLKPERGGDA